MNDERVTDKAMTDQALTSETTVPTTAQGFLRDLIRIPALSGQERTIGERTIQEWRALGFDEAYLDEVGNALGLVRGQETGPAWLLVTHLDHVHEGDETLWTHPPYGAVVDGELIHGRGAVDIKGPLAAQTYALAEVLRAGRRPKRDVWLAAFCDEETGGAGASAFVKRPPAEFGGVIVGEPSSNRLMLGHRGVASVRVRLSGRAHHASHALSDENPIFALGELLARLQQLAFRKFPVTGQTTIAPTQIFTDSGSENLTPNSVDLVLSWRFNESDKENRQTLADLLKDLPAVAELGALWTPDNSPGFTTAPDHPLAGLVARYAAPGEPGIWRFATDGRYTAAAGWPTVGWGPGDENLAHTTREAIGQQELDTYIGGLSALLENEVPPVILA